MAKKKTGLGIDALFPQAEVATENEPTPRAQAKQQPKSTQKGAPSKSKNAGENEPAAPQEERIKTSVELLPETIELIDRIKSQHRREHHRLLPMWKILDEAVRELAQRRLK